MKSKKLFLIIYISIIFSCTNSHGVNQSIAKNNKDVTQKTKEIERYISLGNIPLPIDKDFKEIDIKLKVEKMERLILNTIYRDGKIPASNFKLKRTVSYDRKLESWRFCFNWQVADGGMNIYIENENSKHLEIQWAGNTWKEKREIRMP